MRKKVENNFKQKIVKAEFSEEMKESYLSYALEVINERAIPHAKDGLKPVQRRNLYSMYGLGLTYDKTYKKSARIVGDCIGRFHPHGDTSIYEALVRISQDFTLKMPLVDGHGNFGNIDGDGCAAMRYCVTGDTLINYNNGITQIKDIIKTNLNQEKDINIRVKSLDSKNHKAIKFFNSGKHDVFKVNLNNGMSIKGTSNHPLLIYENNKYVWKTIKDLRPNDLCLIDIDLNNVLFGNNDNLKESKMLGYLLKNDYFISSNIEIKSKKISELKYISDFMNEFFDYKSEIIYLNKNNYKYVITNKKIINYIKDNLNIKKIKHLEIPDNVFIGTKDYIVKFLRSYMDDNCSILSTNNSLDLIIRCKSQLFLEQLQIILSSQFGIYSELKKDNKNNYISYKLIINESFVLRFCDLIGFDNKTYYDVIYKFIKNEKNNIPNYYTCKIKCVTKINKQEVFSIKVDSDCHSFSANGFINHNTEAKLTKFANEMLNELEHNVVDFKPNFDEEESEPTLLPTKFPNLLLNGSDGIGVGIVSKIPTHNLKELNDCIIYYIKKEPSKNERLNGIENSSTTKQLLNFLKGPDFPTGGIIVNKNDLLNIYETGTGKILIRGTIIEETVNGKTNLIITEIPYTYSGRKLSLIQSISDLILNKKIDEITDIRDESTKDIRIVLELKKGVDLEKVKNKLYKLSPIQDTFSVSMIALNNKKPILFSLREYCKVFYEFQKEIFTKKHIYLKQENLIKKEILEGLVKANNYIDVIIDIIRNSPTIEIAENCLKNGITDNINFSVKKNQKIASNFNFTENQTSNILSTTLRKLNGLEFKELEKKLNIINDKILESENIINNEDVLNDLIINSLKSISKEYNIPRKTRIDTCDIIEYKEEKIIEDIHVICDKFGYIKIYDENTYSKIDELNEETIILNEKTTNDNKLWNITNDGLLIQVKLDKIAFNKPKDRGTMLYSLINQKKQELNNSNIVFQIIEDKCNKLLFITKKGYVKIVDKNEFITNRNLSNASKLEKDDSILKIINLNKDDFNKDLIVFTDNNYLRFSIKEILEQKKTSIGTISIKTETNINDASIINEDKLIYKDKEYLVNSLKKQKRGTKGSLLK